MDYFYVGNHKGSVGLNDVYFSGNFKKGNFNTNLAIHFLMTNHNQLDGASQALNKYVGTEFDYSIGWNIAKGAALKMGYSQMLGTNSMVALRGGDTAAFSNWMYAMVTIKPSYTFKKQQ